MNYCFTVCRATDEKVQQETHPNTPAVDVPTSRGAYFFGHFFPFGSSSSSASTSELTNPFFVKASSFTDIDEDLF